MEDWEYIMGDLIIRGIFVKNVTFFKVTFYNKFILQITF